MTRKLKLKGKIVENNLTYKKCADSLKISVTAFSNKIQGKTAFKAEEVSVLSRLLGLDQNEILQIFLS